MEDSLLLELLKKDPNRGMDELVKSYSGLVSSVIRGRFEGFRYLSTDIEDCAADTFSDFWLGLSGYDPSLASVKTYLVAIARNNAAGYLRKNSWRRLQVDPAPSEDGSAPDGLDPVLNLPDPEDETELYDAKKRREKLLCEIEAMGEPDSSIIFRKFFLGESSKAISEAVGMTAANVDTRAHRAVARLKKAFGV
ncbi:MAG: sigma-70 family RNA polymerase sigma factor [Clostridia bacterium]|nr:sigma-70 family RNA polymerase sigma factor [Clostridia bacterium]